MNTAFPLPRRHWLTGGLLLVGLSVNLGQMCGQAELLDPERPQDTTPHAPMATACGLFAADCVALEGTSPSALAAGDFDADTDPDLVVANSGTANVTVLLNDGGPRFTAGANYAVGDNPESIAAGDWDGDGDLDVAVVAGLTLVSLNNQGDGTFGPAVCLIPAGFFGFPMEVVAADLDADGDLDLATTNFFPDNLFVLLNDGAGTFTANTVIVGNSLEHLYLSTIAAGDVNGDGLMDLVVSRFSGRMSILLNTGAATFAAPIDLEVAPNHVLNDLAIVDLDGDGQADLIAADDGDPGDAADNGSVVLLFNQGGGTFGPLSRVPAGAIPKAVAAADFDRDGDPDLAVANELSDDVSLLLNEGTGTFAPAQSLGAGDGPIFVVAVDFDGDGDQDLAVANWQSNTVSVLLNDGSGAFAPGG